MEVRRDKLAEGYPSDGCSKKLCIKDEDKSNEGTFLCYSCGLEEHFHYKGRNPPFTTSIQFLESCYVMKDPFSPTKPTPFSRKPREVNEPFLILGSDCYSCKRPVCRDPDCSVFYKHHYCLSCAGKCIDIFPTQIQKRLKDRSHN